MAEPDYDFEFDDLDDVDLFLALQLQQQLDLAVALGLADDDELSNDSPFSGHIPLPSQQENNDGGEDDSGESDNGNYPSGHEEDEGSDGYEDADPDNDSPPSPHLSVNSFLDFSPDSPPVPLPEPWPDALFPDPSSSEESPLHSPILPNSIFTRRVKTTFSCSICLDDHSEDDIARIPVCDHSFCRDCLREYITSKVSEHRYPVFCPICLTISEEQRPGVVTESVIEEIWIPEKEYVIFEDMQLSSLSVLLHCRQCKETMYVARDEYEADTVIACPLPTCTYRWCTACQTPVPIGSPTHTCDADAGLSAMVRQNGWKFCPGCKAPIQKESGCNHMTCITPGCNVNFCYSCGDTIVRSALMKEIHAATIDHYRESCRLFEDIPDVDVPP